MRGPADCLGRAGFPLSRWGGVEFGGLAWRQERFELGTKVTEFEVGPPRPWLSCRSSLLRTSGLRGTIERSRDQRETRP